MKPNEDLLQYIWKQSCFGKPLSTFSGESVQVIQPGTWNSDEGPDFLDAKIRIDDTILAGHVEVHVLSSDWDKHGHDNNDKYKPIILHVLWENDIDHTTRFPGVPYVELKYIISPTMLRRYEVLSGATNELPCAFFDEDVPRLTWISWLDGLLAERWIKKHTAYLEILNDNQFDWNDLMYKMTSRALGQKVNGSAMQRLAEIVPHITLAKHKSSRLQIESLLFGVSGLIPDESNDEYVNSLRAESQFLMQKYGLTSMSKSEWNFGKLRPANFPTIRIAQLSGIIEKSSHLFSKVIEANSLSELMTMFKHETSPYWHTHFHFRDSTEHANTRLGNAVIYNVIINTVAPIVWSYGLHHHQSELQEKAWNWLSEIPAEKNKKIKILNQINPPVDQASHTQALLELYDQYCTAKQCLKCARGRVVLGKS